MATPRVFIQARITSIETQIAALEAAIEAIESGGVQSYTIDTGQTRRTVTKLEIRSAQISLNSLYNQHVVLNTRLDGCGTNQAVPAW